MADENDGAAAAGHFTHFSQALFLERDVADRQNFIHQQNFGLEVRGDGKRQPHLHPGAVMLQRRIDEICDLGEGDDLVEFSVDFLLAHAENRAVQIGILAAGQLRVKAGADFEQAAHAAADFGATDRGLGDAGENLQQVVLPAPLRPIRPTTSPCAIRTKHRAAPKSPRWPPDDPLPFELSQRAGAFMAWVSRSRMVVWRASAPMR